MSEKVNKNHAMIIGGQAFREACQPIFKQTPINYIGLARLYEDGSRSYLITDPKWGEVLLTNNYHLAGTEDAMIEGPVTSHQLWSISSMFTLNKQTQNLFTDCVANNYGNGISLIERGKNFVEFFHICADSGYEAVNPYLEHHIDQLWHYALFIREAIANDKDLKQIYNEKYYYDFQLPPKNHAHPTAPLPINQYYLGGRFENVYFTKRELDCLKLLYQNKSAKEQSNILNLSCKTIEFYLDNIKKKTQCKNKTELLLELARNQAFKSLIK